MKKFLMVFAAVVLAAVSMNAQPRAIGARLGYGAEVSYQHTLGNNMLSAEISFPEFSGVGAAATYDWINPFGATFPWSHKGEWNWYMGVGAGLGYHWAYTNRVTYSDGTTAASTHDGLFNVGVAGRIGFEYCFWFPLQLSLDWRPVIGPGISWSSASAGGTTTTSSSTVGFYTNALYAGAICLGVRYKF